MPAVDSPGPGGGGNPLERLLGDLLQLMGGGLPGGGRVELARTLAQGAATGGQPEGNVDPAERIELERLAPVAEMHVAELTGMPVVATGESLEVVAVGPGAWAWRTIEDWRFLLEPASPTGSETAPGTTPGDGDDGVTTGSGGAEGRPEGLGLVDLGPDDLIAATGGEPGDLMARWMATMGPLVSGLQLGSAVGHLARDTFGAYELPVPRPTPGTLLVVPANIARFAGDWSLPGDEVRLWVCLREMTIHAVLCRPHVAERLRHLLTELMVGSATDAEAMARRLEGLDLSDPDALEGLLGEPEGFAAVELTPQRRELSEQLAAVTAVLLGYVEHVLDRAGTRLLGGRTALAEAWRRRQVDREKAERGAELLLGLDLTPPQTERGTRFVQGVLERAGEEGLARLWSSSDTLPTPAEVDAPGLWLERISWG